MVPKAGVLDSDQVSSLYSNCENPQPRKKREKGRRAGDGEEVEAAG